MSAKNLEHSFAIDHCGHLLLWGIVAHAAVAVSTWRPLLVHSSPVLASAPPVLLFPHGGESLSHSINLVFFPAFEWGLRRSGVMLEVCPISNQALRCVGDPRLHPARGFLQRGLRGALDSDDPTISGSTGLTDDCWIACLAWGLDLRSLKKLALDSILQSSLPPDRKQRQLDLFQKRWQRFIRGVIEEDGRGMIEEDSRATVEAEGAQAAPGPA